MNLIMKQMAKSISKSINLSVLSRLCACEENGVHIKKVLCILRKCCAY